jgi:uncharacterized membrane protein
MPMPRLHQAGRLCFAIAFAAFGVQHFIYARFVAGLDPPWIPGSPLRACLMGIALVVASIRIATTAKTRVTSMLLGFLLFLYFLFLYAPRLAANLHNPGPWTSGAEILALCGAAFVLAGKPWTIGRYLFAITLTVFGVQHLIYAHFVATLVPSWIPGHLFWAYAVGIAFIATTLSIVTHVKAHLAAALLGLMFFTWVFILHLPRVVSASRNGNEWTSMFVALAMCGGAWIIAGAVQD